MVDADPGLELFMTATTDWSVDCSLAYPTGLYDRATVGRLIEIYQSLLDAVVADTTLRLPEGTLCSLVGHHQHRQP